MADDTTSIVSTEIPTETQTLTVENPTPEPTPPVEQPVPVLPQTPMPSNPPDVPKPEENPQPVPVEEPSASEPTPMVTSELPPVDTPIPNFHFPFNGDFPVTFPFNSQPTTDEMKAKFSQWGITGHHGIDFGLPEGTEVMAVDSGKVFQSSENSDYGISVTIQHPWGQSLYAHLKETKVSEDQEVKAGDLIGISGQTGAAFGPHLHFGIKPNNPNESNGYLGFIDPTQYLPNIPNPQNLPDNSVVEPEKPNEVVPEPKPEEPKPVEVPIPDVSINIEPVVPSPQPIQPLPPEQPVINNDDQIKKQVNEKFDAELEARRFKANEARKTKQQEHLQEIEKFLQDKKEITNQDVRDLTHVSQTTATEYLSTLVKSGSIRMEGKGKTTVYKSVFS